ncbi:MAG TPA: hypothetical protein VL485_19610 [Ktedonobacteraceae bacterium]|nr:hypothetical protein [Ktedonobacteraceae bacterium]
MVASASDGGGMFSLSYPLIPLQVTLDTIIPAFDAILSAMATLDPALKRAADNLTSGDNTGLAHNTDFAGLAARAFQSTTTKQVAQSTAFSTAFQKLKNGINMLQEDIDNAASTYDGKLGQIAGSNYVFAPGILFPSQSAYIQGAQSIVDDLQPYTAMINDVIEAANGNTLLLSGASGMKSQLTSAHSRLVGYAECRTGVTPGLPNPSPSDQAMVIHMVIAAIDAMEGDISQVYQDWGNAIQTAYTRFLTTMKNAETQLQPTLAQLTGTLDAASLYDQIMANWTTNTPIQIEQIGPNRILVLIAGTDPTTMNTDANVWNALGTGMGQNMPYEQDVIDAIRAYIAANGLSNPEVVLAGHSLGGMAAEQVAEKRLFNVTQVVTFGSPTMGKPVPGVQYNIYAAQWDWVPMLSRYENKDLPSSLSQAASLFPTFQTNWEGMENPLNGGHSIVHDLAAPFHDIATAWDDVGSTADDVTSTQYLLQEGTKIGSDMVTPGLKKSYMDPNGLYGNSIQIVPDMTGMNPNVHSQYGNSDWLKQQQVITNVSDPDPSTNSQYFGMPNLPATTKIDQYMSHNTVLSPELLMSMFG